MGSWSGYQYWQQPAGSDGSNVTTRPEGSVMA